MYLKHKPSGSMIEVLDTAAMADPCRGELEGRFHVGEELQEPATFRKVDIAFPSGEPLPRCWMDPHYKRD